MLLLWNQPGHSIQLSSLKPTMSMTIVSPSHLPTASPYQVVSCDLIGSCGRPSIGMTRNWLPCAYSRITSVGVWTILAGGPMRGTPPGLQWNSGSSFVPLRSRYCTRSQNSGLYIGISGPMRWVTPESRSKLMPGAQFPASNCCFEQGRPRCRTVRLPFSSGFAAPPPPPPPPHMPVRSGWPPAPRGVGTFCSCWAAPRAPGAAGAPPYCAAWRDTKDIAAARAAAMPSLFSWFTAEVLGCLNDELQVVRVVRIFVIHRHGPAVRERERHDAAGVRAVARRGIGDFQRLADLEDAGHAVLPKRLRARAGDFPRRRGAVGLLDLEEPADVRVDHRELGQRSRELTTLCRVEFRLKRVMRNGRLRRQAQGDNHQHTENLLHNHLSARRVYQIPQLLRAPTGPAFFTFAGIGMMTYGL